MYERERVLVIMSMNECVYNCECVCQCVWVSAYECVLVGTFVHTFYMLCGVPGISILTENAIVEKALKLKKNKISNLIKAEKL